MKPCTNQSKQDKTQLCQTSQQIWTHLGVREVMKCTHGLKPISYHAVDNVVVPLYRLWVHMPWPQGLNP